MNVLCNSMIKIAKKNKRMILLVISVILIIPSIAFGADNNLTSNSKMSRPKASEVENSTIIIGTHMISLNALTQELDEIAQKTIADSGQDKIYYKSEISDVNRDQDDNDGVWYEIQDAQDINDILYSGKTMVSNELIDRLVLTYYTDKNGRTYNLSTGNEVDIFNIVDVYDISSMEELKSLKLEYDAKKDSKPKDDEDKDREKSLNKIKNSLKSVFELEFDDEETEEGDLLLDELRKYYDYIILRGASNEERDELSKIRNAVNAQRKELVVDRVIAKIDEEMQNVDELVDSYGEAKNELLNSKEVLGSQISILELDENASLIQKKMVQLVQSLIGNVKNNDYSNADENLKDILALNAISASIIVDKNRQNALIEDLEREVNAEYNELISAGESEEYKQARVLNKGMAVLDNLKNQYQNKLKMMNADLDFIENMKLKLMDSVDKQSNELQSVVDSLSKQIGDLTVSLDKQNSQQSDLLAADNVDSFKEIALKILKERFDSVNEKLQASVSQLEPNNDTANNEQKMEKLKEEYRRALDKNDLNKAKEIQEDIDKLQSSIDETNLQLNNRLAELKKQLADVENKLNQNSLDKSQQAALETQKTVIKSTMSRLNLSKLGQGKAANQIVNQAKSQAKDALSKISMSDQDVMDLSDSVLAIKDVLETQPQIAYPAMAEIADDIKSKIATDDTSAANLLDVASEIDQAIEDYEDRYKSLVDEGLDESNLDEKINVFASDNNLNDTSKNVLALGALNELLADYGTIDDNMSPNDLNQNQKVIKLKMDKILSFLTSQNSDSLSGVKAVLTDNKFENGEVYISAEVVADLLDMQYVWNHNLVNAWLVGKNKKYNFTKGKNVIISVNGKNKTMSNVAVFTINKHNKESILWLPKSFLIDEFEITIQNIITTNKSTVYDSSAYDMMKKMLEYIKR